MEMVSRWLIAMVLLAVAMPVRPVFSAGGDDYEIPLSDLKKVEKKKPKKAETRKHTGKKKAAAARQAPPREESGPVEIQPAPLVPETAMRGEGFAGPPDSDHISHEPYSYVVPGKLTVLKAIISRDAVQYVRCRFRSLERGGYASVAMTKAPGSQFTYVATLPPLEPGVAALLRYRIVAMDASGTLTYSEEFVIPVKSTSVMPGWQQDPSGKPVGVTLEDPRQPLEGFSDVVVENAAGL